MADRQDLCSKAPIPAAPLAIAGRFQPHATVTLYHGDRLDLLRDIATSGEKAELIVTSPPYNLGKEYESRSPLSEYVDHQRETIAACLDILSATGSICWQVGHFIEGAGMDKEAYPLDLVLYPVFKELGLKLRNRIVWHFGHGLHERYRFTGRHEAILWFTQDTTKYTFNLDAVRVPQKYPGKRAYRGPNKGRPSGNPRGKNPSDVWDMPNVKANHIEKTGHPCQFPIGLVQRLILALTNEGDLVVDPYLGVGTTAAASVLCGRRTAGSDTEARYIQVAQKRVRDAANGSLRYRPMNKPVYQPHGTLAVAAVPDEWRSVAAQAHDPVAGSPVAQKRLFEGSDDQRDGYADTD